MITVYPYDHLGRANHGWLDARHHFSFASYYDRHRLQFGALRVINDDIIAPKRGFGAHPHRDMEIITYVRSGAISHEDSLGNKGRTEAGNVQVMSAGSGVIHAELNQEDITTRLYQIWIEPQQKNVVPRWEMRQFPQQERDGLHLLVSGQPEHDGQNAAFIYQDAAIYGGRLAAGEEATLTIKHQAYILASDGQFSINRIKMQKGDGAEVTGEKQLQFRAETAAELLVIDVPEDD